MDRQLIPDDDVAHLLDLVGFRFRTLRLKVQDFSDAHPGEDVMAALRPDPEPECLQKVTQIAKADIRVGCPSEHLGQDARMSTHVQRLACGLRLDPGPSNDFEFTGRRRRSGAMRG